MIRNPARRRAARLAARTGVIGSGVMLSLTVWGLSLSGIPSASAAIDAGAVAVIHPIDGSPTSGDPLSSGGSATAFSLLPPTGAGCLGDSANDNYRVQSYVVPSSVDPGSLNWDASGPVPNAVGASFRQPLYNAETSGAYVDELTLDNPGSPRPRPGEVINVPAFSFDVFEPANLPAGTYNVGLACTLGAASATQLDRFWNVQLEVVEDVADEPAGITWSVVEGTTTTTTDSTTTTADGGSTTTTTDGATTTTTDDGTTTTTDGTDTTTPPAFVAGGEPTSGGTAVLDSVATLPVTGGSTMSLVVWAVLLLTFGRMAVLLGRAPRVRPAA